MRTADELIVLAVQTETRLRIVDGEFDLQPGPCVHPDTVAEFVAAGPQLVERLRDLFGAEDIGIHGSDPAPEDDSHDEDWDSEVDWECDEEDDESEERFPIVLSPEQAEALRQSEIRAAEERKASGFVPRRPMPPCPVLAPVSIRAAGKSLAVAPLDASAGTACPTDERSASRSLSEPPLALDPSSSTAGCAPEAS